MPIPPSQQPIPFIKFTDLPYAQSLDGTEIVPIVQNGNNVKTTTASLMSGIALNYSFLTATSESGLAFARQIAGANGVTIADNGAGSTLVVGLSGEVLKLQNNSTAGILTDTGSTIVGRALIQPAAGLTIANPAGGAGNPTFALANSLASLQGLSGTGMIARTASDTLTLRTLQGTNNQIVVTNGDGVLGAPTFGIVNNAVLPGVGAITLPIGSTAQRPAASMALIRYNNTLNLFETSDGTNWNTIVTSNIASPTSFYQNGVLASVRNAENFVDNEALFTLTDDIVNNRVNISAVLNNDSVIAKTLTAYSSTTGTVTSADSILTAIEKVDGNFKALVNPVTGTGVLGEVSFWTGTNTQGGDTNLFWDNIDKWLGIGTSTPISTLTIEVDNLGPNAPTTAQTLVLQNITPAVNGTQQDSPGITWQSFGFGTTLATSQLVAWKVFSSTTQSTTATGTWALQSSINGAAFTNRLTVTSGGTVAIAGTLAVTGTAATITNTRTAIAVTSSDGFICNNSTAATAAIPVQYSPRLRWSGTAWNTTPTAASNVIDFIAENQPVSGTTTSGNLIFSSQINAAGFNKVFTISSNGTITLVTATSGILKTTAGVISNATAGTDYQAAGNYITALTGDITATGPGSVAATLATVNANVGTFTNATITVNAKGLITAASSGGGGGTVTSVSVVSTNGFAGTVATATTTPAITLTTTITGLLKGNATAISAAVAGTDYEVPLTFTTGLTRSTNTITVNTTQNITTLSNLTVAGSVQTTSGGVLSSIANTGTGNNVLATTPTLVTPVLGVATATSINKVTITAPTTSATLTLVTGSSLITAGAFAITLTSTAATNVTLPTSGTLYGTATGSITSAQLLGSLTDETGSGSAVFATSPTLVTPVLGTPASGNLSNCTNYPTATTSTAGIITEATTAQVTAETANVYSDAASMKYHKGIAKAWVRFVGSTAVISDSYNVSSITRSAAGAYAVNLSITMANTNYCVTSSIAGVGFPGANLLISSQTTTVINITTQGVNAGSSVQADSPIVCVAVLGQI